MADAKLAQRCVKAVGAFFVRGAENVAWNLVAAALWAVATGAVITGAALGAAMGLIQQHWAFGYVAAFSLGSFCYAGFHTLLAWWSTQVRLRMAKEEWSAQRSLFVEVRHVQIDAPCILVLHLTIYNVSPFPWTVQSGSRVSVRLGAGSPTYIPLDVVQIKEKTHQVLVLQAPVPEPIDGERWLPVHIDEVKLYVSPREGAPRDQTLWQRQNMLGCVATQREIRGVKAPPKPAGPGSAE